MTGTRLTVALESMGVLVAGGSLASTFSCGGRFIWVHIDKWLSGSRQAVNRAYLVWRTHQFQEVASDIYRTRVII